MRMNLRWSTAWLILFAITGSPTVHGEDVLPSVGIEGVTIVEIGTFDLGGRKLRIYSSSRNDGLPIQQRQYRYDPVFLVEVDDLGKPQFAEKTKNSVGEWETSFTLILSRRDIDTIAHDRVQQLIGDQTLTHGNVAPRPVSWLKVQLGQNANANFPELRLVRQHWNTNRPAARVVITLASKSEEEIDRVRLSPSLIDLDLQYDVTGAKTVEDTVVVSSQEYRSRLPAIRVIHPPVTQMILQQVIPPIHPPAILMTLRPANRIARV